MKSRPNIRSSPYLLLEVLISIALISLCAIPLLTPHFTIARREAETIRDIQFELKACETFEQIREQLYLNDIPWGRKNKPATGELGDASYVMTVAEQYVKGTGELRRTYRVLDIKITIDGKSRTFQLFAEKVKP